MFKKNTITINANNIISFFDMVANQEVFNSNSVNESWLWYKLQFILDFLKENKNDVIDKDTLLDLFNAEKHKKYFTENSDELIKSNCLIFDELTNREPILNSLSTILISSWDVFEDKLSQKNTIEKISKKHLKLILDFSTISFIAVSSFYIYNFFKLNLVFFGLILLSSLFIYKQFKNIVTKIKNKKEEKTIIKKLNLLESKSDTKENVIILLIKELGLEPWSSDGDINLELNILKNKTLRFISVYKSNQENSTPQMLFNVEKMWREHIPLFINKLEYNQSDKITILKAINSMDNVIQNHIEELFWHDSLEISAKQRYWLNKETEKNF